LDKEKKSESDNTDAKTLELVNRHFKEARTYREIFEEEWKEQEDFYDGKHWKDKNRSYKNLIFPMVEQEVATLMDALPSTDLLSRNPSREADAKMLEGSVHYTYEQQVLSLKLEMMIRSGIKTGTGFLYVDYDPDAENGQGITTIKNVSWENLYLDPTSNDVDDGFVGIKFPTRVEEAKRKHPKFADKIKPSGSSSVSSGTDARGLHEDRANYMRGRGSQEEKYKVDGMCEIEEAWLRDFTMEKIPESETIAEIKKETEQFFKLAQGEGQDIPDIGKFEDHPKHIEAHYAQLNAIVAEALGIDTAIVSEADVEGLKADPVLGVVINLIQDHIRIHESYMTVNPKGERPKYENGIRLVIKIGNVIVYDGNPPVNDGLVPVVPFYCYKDEKSIWGTGEVKNMLPAQKSFNEMDHAEFEGIHLVGNPGWTIESDCGVKPSEITNKRGKVYVINKGTNFKRLDAGMVSPQLMQRKTSDHQFMQIITGLNEASQGRLSGGVTAAAAIERLQQQANGRMRLKSTSLALYTMPRLGKLVASRNAKYWTTERFMRVSDKQTGQVQIVKFDPEQVRDLDYDIRVVQSSLAGTDKEAQSRVMEAYVDKGWIPPKVYFQTIDVPNKAKILEALEEADQQRMLLEQLATENEQLKLAINGGVPAEQSVPAEMAQPIA
jgi:hypothetical protein